MERGAGMAVGVKRAEFDIPGEPKGKGRPRFTRNGHTYTPRDTAEYEKLVKLEYKRQCGEMYFPKGTMLIMYINAFYGIPKSTGRKQRERMLLNEICPVKKPDLDNIVKIIADSLNKVAYDDDAQIVNVSASKAYSDLPGVYVTIMERVWDGKE